MKFFNTDAYQNRRVVGKLVVPTIENGDELGIWVFLGFFLFSTQN